MNQPDYVALRETLAEVSVATLTSQLLKRGIRSTFMAAVRPLRPDLRLCGRAVTLRYAPAREDLWVGRDFDNRTNPQRLAVERIGPGDVLVIDARGDQRGAALGHILATRIKVRGGAGIVTDGALRDTPDFRSLDLPVYAAGANAISSLPIHHPVDLDVPIGCDGVLVIPGDLVVGDAEGVVVLPKAIVDEVVRDALEQEFVERGILERVEAGESILSLYPPSKVVLAELKRRTPPP